MFTGRTQVPVAFMCSLSDSQIQALYESRAAKWRKVQSEPSRWVDFVKDIRAGRLTFLFEGEMDVLNLVPMAA